MMADHSGTHWPESMGRIPRDLRGIPETEVRRWGRGTTQSHLSWSDARWLMAHHVLSVGLTAAGRGFAVARRRSPP